MTCSVQGCANHDEIDPKYVFVGMDPREVCAQHSELIARVLSAVFLGESVQSPTVGTGGFGFLRIRVPGAAYEPRERERVEFSGVTPWTDISAKRYSDRPASTLPPPMPHDPPMNDYDWCC